MKIFISHSGHDKWVARQLSALLQADGHKTFLDEKDIKTGESIDASIQANLKDSDHLLLLLSPASLTSHWVFIELGGAKALGKHIVPVLLHVSGNQIPQAISQLLARDINDIDKYLDELKKLQSVATASPDKVAAVVAQVEAEAKEANVSLATTYGGFSIGDKVWVAQVEHLTDEDKAKWPTWVKSMDKYSGVVTRITGFSPAGAAYLEAEPERMYKWNINWLSRAA
jgi:hypothetical protein